VLRWHLPRPTRQRWQLLLAMMQQQQHGVGRMHALLLLLSL
jgi:hypothetical protein